MSKAKDKKEDQRPSTIIVQKDDGVTSSRTDRALEYQFSRTSIVKRLEASEEFRNKAINILGDRFVERPEVKMLIETFSADLHSSYGAGIAEQEPLGLRNLNSDEYFFMEFARSRRECTIYNRTSHPITDWDYDVYRPKQPEKRIEEEVRRRNTEEMITRKAKELSLTTQQTNELHDTIIAPGGMRIYQPGDIMRYGEDNPWTILMGTIVLRILHHNPFRAIPALEGRPQITLFKEEMVEKKPSWDKPQDNQIPRTPAQ